MYIALNPSLAGMPRPEVIEPALASLLNQSSLQVGVVNPLQRAGSWVLEAPSDNRGRFHLVSAGRCLIESAVLNAPQRLEAGDLVIFPHGDAHRLRGINDACLSPPEQTGLICGELRFTGSSLHPLRQALPGCVVIRANHASPAFRQLASMMVEAVHAGEASRYVLLNKLADALFTLAICDYARGAGERRGLFASLADPRIARVLLAVHKDPGLSWSMQSMASLACMSRSAFAERFTQLMRIPPVQYVTQWRVSMAEQLLRDRQQSVAGIAQQLGYSSEASFRRLFKRVSGMCPGRVRAQGDRSFALN